MARLEPGAAWDSAAVFVVDADGSNLRRVTPSSVHAIGPPWSPDGTRLAFDGSDFVVNADGTSVLDIKDDIFTDRHGRQRAVSLTDDGISSLPDWTSAGEAGVHVLRGPDRRARTGSWMPMVGTRAVSEARSPISPRPAARRVSTWRTSRSGAAFPVRSPAPSLRSAAQSHIPPF